MRKIGFDNLPSDKQQAFLDRLKLLGLDPRRVIGRHLRPSDDGELRISGDLGQSHVAMHMRTVYNVAAMKALGGVPNALVEQGDDVASYPAALAFDSGRLLARYPDRRAVQLLLGEERRAMVESAYRAWMIGNSKKVQALGYEPLINALHFPQRVLVAAADSITVGPGQSATFGQGGEYPANLSVVDVLLQGSGTLQFLSDSVLTVTNALERTAS